MMMSMSAVTIHCQKSYYKKQWILFVAVGDRVNRGKATLKNGQAGQCRHCCASQTMEVDEDGICWSTQRRLGVTEISYL